VSLEYHMKENSDSRPLLSIVIATRNRVPYAVSAIQSILENPDQDLELVVQDNSDSSDLETWIKTNVCDYRLRYGRIVQPLSFVGNFNAAAEAARGEYVCFIGDDDGVNPEIMDAARWAKRGDLDAVAVKHSLNYLWRDSGVASTLFTKVTGGSLYINPFSGIVIYADMEKEMKSLVRNGGLYYLQHSLPKLYHGLVHRRCLQAIHARTGVYFAGLSPDTFASLAIACVARRVAVVDYPLTIPGACKVSGTVLEGSIKKHSRRLEDAPHLRHRGEYKWCELVPRVYSVETIWVDSSVAALRAMGREDLVQELNLAKLAAYCIGANRGVAKPVLRDMLAGLRIMGKSRVVGTLQFAMSLLSGPAVAFARRARNRLLIMAGRRIVCRIDNLENMVDVSHALAVYLRGHGCRFSECIRGEGK